MPLRILFDRLCHHQAQLAERLNRVTNRHLLITNAVLLAVLTLIGLLSRPAFQARDQSQENAQKLDQILQLLQSKSIITTKSTTREQP
jgi:cytoskeletal protein RodZ